MHVLMYLLAAVIQAPDSGAFVITLGQDTIGVERYARTADRLVDDMVLRDRAPVITRHLVAELGPDKQTLVPCQGEACTLPSRARMGGTDYTADSDLVRVDVKTEPLPQPVEQFTIAVLPQGEGGVIRMDWETTRIVIPFARKQT